MEKRKEIIVNEFYDENEENELDEELDNNTLTAYDIAVFYNTYDANFIKKSICKSFI